MEINELLTEHCNLFTNTYSNSCLGSPMDRGAWRATAHGIAKSQTWLSMHARTQQEPGGWKLIPLLILKPRCSAAGQRPGSYNTALQEILLASVPRSLLSLSFPPLPKAVSYCPSVACLLTLAWSSWKMNISVPPTSWLLRLSALLGFSTYIPLLWLEPSDF